VAAVLVSEVVAQTHRIHEAVVGLPGAGRVTGLGAAGERVVRGIATGRDRSGVVRRAGGGRRSAPGVGRCGRSGAALLFTLEL
jgi:hypothetical protein